MKSICWFFSCCHYEVVLDPVFDYTQSYQSFRRTFLNCRKELQIDKYDHCNQNSPILKDDDFFTTTSQPRVHVLAQFAQFFQRYRRDARLQIEQFVILKAENNPIKIKRTDEKKKNEKNIDINSNRRPGPRKGFEAFDWLRCSVKQNDCTGVQTKWFIAYLPFHVFVPALKSALARRCLAVFHPALIQCVAHRCWIHYHGHASVVVMIDDLAIRTPKFVR